jgi:hypothetical protein
VTLAADLERIGIADGGQPIAAITTGCSLNQSKLTQPPPSRGLLALFRKGFHSPRLLHCRAVFATICGTRDAVAGSF